MYKTGKQTNVRGWCQAEEEGGRGELRRKNNSKEAQFVSKDYSKQNYDTGLVITPKMNKRRFKTIFSTSL